MTLIPTVDLVGEAASAGGAICAFNVVHLETAEALVGAAEQTGIPIILQLSENCVRFHGALAPVSRAMMSIAAGSHARVAVHLDHARDVGLALEAIDFGFGSVMYDGAHLAFEENVATTRRVVAAARASSVGVEAELGEIGGKDGAHAPGVRTDPDEAALFVDATGVDLLAVAVGSSHAMSDRSATLDVDLISRLHAAVPVPLVLHGSSGVSDGGIHEAVRRGISKVNVSTQLNRCFTDAVRAALAANPDLVDSRKYVELGRFAVREEAARLQRLTRLALV